MSVKQDLRPVVLAACIAMFAEGFGATMSFPFASFMVETLRGTAGNLGTMTALFFTAFSIGPLLTARMWASMANYVGRRACLLTSLSCSTILTLAIAASSSYEVAVGLRFAQGLLTCSLPMARTCLREKVDEVKGDEVWAFSLLSTSFAASSLCGPAIGGILYALQPAGLSIFPWTVPHVLASCLYMMALGFNYVFMVETANMEVSSAFRRQQSGEVSLIKNASIPCFLVMAAGHSYVFTGWEVGYPLLARSNDLEGWTSEMIGITFLVGNAGLLIHTLFTFPVLVKRLGLTGVWTSSWIVCIVAIFMFPRVLTMLLRQGFDGRSPTVVSANYVAQLFVSILQGCNFTTLQLMLNRLISMRSDSEYSLPLANGWLVSLQSLARAISPVVTGTLVSYPSVFQGVLAFDALSGIALVCCVLFGYILQKAESSSSVLARERGSSKINTAHGYQQLMDADDTM